MNKIVSSTSNPLVKTVQQLYEKAKFRKETGLFVVEGLRETRMAVKGGYRLKTLLYNPGIVAHDDLSTVITPDCELVEINDAVYEKLAYREGTEGLIGIFESRKNDLESVKINQMNPLILVAESPEKPGNIGALLRTADAAGVDLFVLANPKTDLYNPNVLRASLGAVFTTNVVSATSEETLKWLSQNKISVYCAYLSEKSVAYYSVDFKKGCAIVLGTESEGLSDYWVRYADKNIIIPMHGQVDSMNVSVSGAILLFEAVRQRSQK